MRNEQTVDEIIAFGDCRSNLSAHRQKPASDRENTGGNGNSVMRAQNSAQDVALNQLQL